MRYYYAFLEKLESMLLHNFTEETILEFLDDVKAATRTKIHALFLTQELSCWPSLESVFWAAYRNPDYEASLVYTPFFHKNFSEQVDYYEAYREMGVPVQRYNEYDLIVDSPDVVFIIKPYANIPEYYHTEHLEKVIPRLIYIPYGMENTMDLIQYSFQYYSHYKAWRHCAYGPIVKEYGKKYGYRNGENIVVWGHPKADHFVNLKENKKNISPEWQKRIKGRKTILYTPHHLVNLSDNGTGTWLVWGEKILELAEKNKGLFFIMRPHPLMMGALVNSGALSEAQAEQLRQRIDNAENILWDTNPGYHEAFDAADAIITDGTTFSIEFLYTKKPILLTPRNMEGFFLYQEMLDSYYVVNDVQDIANFMQMVLMGEDPLKEKRLAMFNHNFFVPQDCSVGENIMINVKIDLEKECREIDVKMESKEVSSVNRKLEMDQPLDVIQFPLFSILVLCYKNQDLLFGMLDSIFKQDYPRIQLVVSDDGSEDFDIETVQSYIDLHKRPNIVDVVVRKNEVNMRTVPHIHKAMSYVTGDYLVFTAADDRFFGTDVISSYVEQFLSNPEKVWLVAKCNMTTPDYKKTRYVTPTAADDPYFRDGDARLLFSRWSRRGMAIPCCMAFRKDAIDMVGGFDLDYLFLEDWPLELKLLRNGHAPIYSEKITAIHSTGGISNSNDRYGKEIRRLFYEDKYTIFRKEVNPYLHLLTKEDKKAYKQYMKEIMARHYFFYIDWPEAPTVKRFFLCLRKPIRFWWVFEQRFMKLHGKIPRKKMLIASQVLLVLSMLFLNTSNNLAVNAIFKAMGWVDFAVGLGMMLGALVTFPLEKHFVKKAKLRHNLVN